MSYKYDKKIMTQVCVPEKFVCQKHDHKKRKKVHAVTKDGWIKILRFSHITFNEVILNHLLRHFSSKKPIHTKKTILDILSKQGSQSKLKCKYPIRSKVLFLLRYNIFVATIYHTNWIVRIYISMIYLIKLYQIFHIFIIHFI